MEAGSLREAGEERAGRRTSKRGGMGEIVKNVTTSRNISQQEQHTQTGTTKDGGGNR